MLMESWYNIYQRDTLVSVSLVQLGKMRDELAHENLGRVVRSKEEKWLERTGGEKEY